MTKIIKNYEELVKEGYGQGHGRDYKSCKTVHNFSSIGRSHEDLSLDEAQTEPQRSGWLILSVVFI